MTGGIPVARAGKENLAFNNPDLMAATTIVVTSSEFAAGQPIPFRFSTDGENISPPVSWSHIPAEAKSLVLLVEDPDAPLPKPFVHWIAFNVAPINAGFSQGISSDEKSIMLQGKNSNLKNGWTGMAPPKGDTPHHYHFQIFALDEMLNLETGCGRSALFKAMASHVLARGELVGTFRR